MFDFLRASDEVIDQRRQLAAQVCEALGLAGVPSRVASDGAGRPAGAEVEVDGAADEAGGVYVNWRPDPKLSEAVMESALAGRTTDPAVRLSEAFSGFMRDAMVGILRESGFAVEPFNDPDMRPPAVRVLGREVP
ncbi:hypothetical protein ABT095_27415 [Kitasatospora sp. NPDC002227]|uniref:hypothetical protein n=1 Tax=Kitasatospora sp. NPDC002227 TaxID=3154773 RepID=UPI00332DF12B